MKQLYVTQQYDHAQTPSSTAVAPIVDHYRYIVDKVVNSVNPPIKSILSPDDLSFYVVATDWKVTIV